MAEHVIMQSMRLDSLNALLLLPVKFSGVTPNRVFKYTWARKKLPLYN